MSTERQKQANRRNARLSTGPRSATGKATSSQNSRTHGFSSRIAVLTEPEDREIFDSRLQEYLEAYGTGRPADIFYAFAAINAEFQYIFINRARAGFVRFARERALDQLWGPQPVPEDPNSAFDLNTRLTGYAVMRDFNQSDILLKMSRYEREQIRTIDRAVQQMERNQAAQSEEADAGLQQALNDFLQNSAVTEPEAPPAAGTRCDPGVPAGETPENKPETHETNPIPDNSPTTGSIAESVGPLVAPKPRRRAGQTPPFPPQQSFQNGPRRQGFAAPRWNPRALDRSGPFRTASLEEGKGACGKP